MEAEQTVELINDRLDALLRSHSEVSWFTLPAAALAVLNARTDLMAAEHRGGEAAIAAAKDALAEAEAEAARNCAPFRFRMISESEQRGIRKRAGDVQAAYACDRESRAQWTEKLSAAFDTEDPEALYDFYLDVNGHSKAGLDPEALPSPRELLQAAAERYREYEKMVDGLCPLPLAAKISDVIDELETVALETDWRDYIVAGMTIHLTDVERRELADIDEDDPDYERLISARYEEFFGRRRAVELELRRQEYDKRRAELAKQPREHVLRLLTDYMLGSQAKEAAAQHMLLEWIAAMTEVPVETETDGDWGKALSGPWRRLFDGPEAVAQVDLLAGNTGDGALLYTFLVERVKALLPREEAQLVQSASFRGALEPL